MTNPSPSSRVCRTCGGDPDRHDAACEGVGPSPSSLATARELSPCVSRLDSCFNVATSRDTYCSCCVRAERIAAALDAERINTAIEVEHDVVAREIVTTRALVEAAEPALEWMRGDAPGSVHRALRTALAAYGKGEARPQIMQPPDADSPGRPPLIEEPTDDDD